MWETAFHEAGHVIAEVVIAGSFPDGCYLADAAVTDHAGRTFGRSFLGVEHLVSTDPEAAALIGRLRANYAAVLLAGDIARDIALEYRVDAGEVVIEFEDEDIAPSSDLGRVQSLLSGLDHIEAEIFIEQAHQAAEAALRERWGDVERLAVALVERRSLDRDALFELLDA